MVSGYISGGHRFGDWTTHLTYSIKDEKENKSELEVGEENSHTMIYGVNYNISPTSILKFELTDHKQDSTYAYSLGDSKLFSVGVDFVF